MSSSCIEHSILLGLSDFPCNVEPQCPRCTNALTLQSLKGKISQDVHSSWKLKKALQNQEEKYVVVVREVVQKGVNDLEASVNRRDETFKKQLQDILDISNVNTKYMHLLSLLAAQYRHSCPHIVSLVPVVKDYQDSLKDGDPNNPNKPNSRENVLEKMKNWYKTNTKQTYEVTFYCSHSYEQGHDPFRIEVEREWVVKCVPWLQMCLEVITQAANMNKIPIPPLKLKEFEIIWKFLKGVSNSETIQVFRTLASEDTEGKQARETAKKFAGEHFEALANIVAPHSEKWTSKMMLVQGKEGTPVWVNKNQLKALGYSLRDRSLIEHRASDTYEA